MNSFQGKAKVKPCAAAVAFIMQAVFIFIAASAVPSLAQIPTPTLLYGFQEELTDVTAPWGAIAQGRDGNMYGTGAARGANSNGGVFKITPSGVEALLVSFPSNWPNCQGLTLAQDGNFYGTCSGGGPGPTLSYGGE